jgi:beta-lactamase regulating signal transducer with metallopeptidase domain
MAFFNYLLELSVCITALYLFYLLIMQQEKLFRLNRFYLLSALVFSVITPLININLPSGAPKYLNDIVLSDGIIANITPDLTEKSSFILELSLSNILMSIYVIGVLVMFVRFLNSCINIIFLSRKGERIAKENYTLILIDKELPIFSFLNYVFLYKNHNYSEQEKAVILTHEVAHISERHTLDILLMEFIKIALWFNPIVYQYQKKLKEVHEYLADEAVVNTKCTPVQYATLMMQEARKHTPHTLPITHYFHNQLKNRLIMLNKIKKPSRGFKTFLSLPVILTLFIAFSVNGDIFGQKSNSWEKDKKGTWVIKGTPDAPNPDVPPSATPGNCYAKCLPGGGSSGTAEWKQVICPSVQTESYMKKVTQALKAKGYTVGAGPIESKKALVTTSTSKKYTLDEVTKVALIQFQKDNKISVGFLSAETAELLNLPTK